MVSSIRTNVRVRYTYGLFVGTVPVSGACDIFVAPGLTWCCQGMRTRSRLECTKGTRQCFGRIVLPRTPSPVIRWGVAEHANRHTSQCPAFYFSFGYAGSSFIIDSFVRSGIARASPVNRRCPRDAERCPPMRGGVPRCGEVSSR